MSTVFESGKRIVGALAIVAAAVTSVSGLAASPAAAQECLLCWDWETGWGTPSGGGDYTVGDKISFEFAEPGDDPSDLLAHEVAHTVQTGGGSWSQDDDRP